MTPELRELDAWIAEHVMGWRRVQSAESHRTEEIVSRVEGDGLCSFNEPWQPQPGGVFFQQWRYFIPTTDPAAAMMVLEKCAKKQAVNVWYSTVHKQWAAADSGCFHTQYAETLPLAICMFAKKLYGKV